MSIRIEQVVRALRFITTLSIIVLVLAPVMVFAHVPVLRTLAPSLVIFGIPVCLFLAVLWGIALAWSRAKHRVTAKHSSVRAGILIAILIMTLAIALSLLAIGLSGFSANH